MFTTLQKLFLGLILLLGLSSSISAATPQQPGPYIGISSINSTSVRISFLDKSNDETGFRIYDGDTIDMTIPANDETTHAYVYATLTGLQSNKLYTIRVVAFNNDGDSLPSNARDFKISSTFGYPPNQPGPYLGVSGIDSSSVRVSFMDNSNNEAGFRIYDGNSIDITLPANDETQPRQRYVYATLSGLNCNQTYQIKAEAFNSAGNSPATKPKIFNINTTFNIPCTVIGNQQPVAEAGQTQNVSEGSTVQLDGSASFDPDQNPLTYKWKLVSKPTNSNASLSDANITNPVFTADQQGSYTFELIVNDGQIDSTPDTVTIVVNNQASATQEVALCANQSAYVSTLYSLGMNINSNTAHGSVLSKNNNFVGAVFCGKFPNANSSSDVLAQLKNNAFPSAVSVISNNGADGSIKAQYEFNGANTQAFAQLKSILQAAGETNFATYVDYSGFDVIPDFFIDIYVHYVNATTTYVIVTVTDKSQNNTDDLNALVSKSIVAQSNSQNTQTDTFNYSGNTLMSDVLFVMDDSGSMSQEQSAASQAIITTFGSAMTNRGVNWKATVIGTEEGRDYLNKHINDPSINDISKLSNQLLLGTWGSDEVGLKRAYQYLNSGDITVRASSKLSIVYVSDENCHTQLSELDAATINDTYFVQNNIKVNVIIPESLSNNNNLAYQMANVTGGEVANIYNYATGYDAMMQKIADDAAGSASQIILSQTPIVTSIQVTVNGTPANSSDWVYNVANNSIVFNAGSAPNANDVVAVTYNY